MSTKLKSLSRAGFAALLGGLLPLAFAPFPSALWPLALLCPATFLLLIHTRKPRTASRLGFAFGLGFFGVGTSWVFVSIHEFGGSPVWLALIITGLFLCVLACFPAAMAYALQKVHPRLSWFKCAVSYPLLWIGAELLRSVLFTGFPWLLIGYSQLHSPLSGFAPLVGVYGVGFLVIVTSGLLVWFGLKQRGLLALLSCLLVLGCIWWGGVLLTKQTWTHPLGSPLKVSLIQGNIPQKIRWDPTYAKMTQARYERLTREHWDSDIILWPEAAIPIPLPYSKPFLDALAAEALTHHTAIVTGVPVALPGGEHYENALLALGTGSGQYSKHQLVPFGEYVPFDSFIRGIIAFLDLPMSSFLPGPANQPPLTLGNHIKLAASICYEIAYPWDVYRQARTANIIVTASNDAWFGHSFASAQHLQMAQMRSLETGLPGLFVTNTGITAIINARGTITGRLPAFKTAVLEGTVQPMTGQTPIAGW